MFHAARSRCARSRDPGVHVTPRSAGRSFSGVELTEPTGTALMARPMEPLRETSQPRRRSRSKSTAFATVLSLCLALACRKPPPAETHPLAESTAAPDSPPSPPAPADAGLPPLTKALWFERLDLPCGYVAFVSVPLGATSARPIMVAAHGAGDRSEWACGAWRGVTDAFPFIVCPQGGPDGQGDILLAVDGLSRQGHRPGPRRAAGPLRRVRRRRAHDLRGLLRRRDLRRGILAP